MAPAVQKKSFFLTKSKLHSAVLNPQGSKQLLKELVPMSVSFILHQRVQFAEKNFRTRTYDGIQYKAFKPKLQNATLQNVRDWVNGALEALDKNYLRELYIILANVDDPDVVFESYKFQFKYMGDDVINLDLSLTEKDLQQSTDSLFRAIDSLKEHTRYQEDELDIKMAISYYEDVTPFDYNPPFYNQNEKNVTVIQQSLKKQSGDYLFLGLLKTGHHTLKCRGKGDVFSMNRTVSSLNLTNQRQDEPNNSESLEAEPPAVLETEPRDNQEAKPQSPDNQRVEEFDRRCTATPTVSELSAIEIPDVATTEEILCSCKISASFEHIGQVECSQCATFQHCVCLGYLSADDIPHPYVCPACNDIYECTPITEHKKKILSTYRLAVAVAYFTESFPQEVMAVLDTGVKDFIVKKMKECKVAKKQDDGQYIINMEFLRNSHIKGIFSNSFMQKKKAISDNSAVEKEPKEAKPQSPDNQRVEEIDRRCTATPTISELSAIEIPDVATTEEIMCSCKIFASFEHIGQVECSQCATFQHCVCLGYLNADDIPHPYFCPACNDIDECTPITEHKKKILSTYRLAVAVAYFTESFPQEVMAVLETGVKDFIVKRMKECKVAKKQDDGQYIINLEFLRNSHIKGMFSNSFMHKRKAISDNSALEEKPKEAKGPGQKKKRSY